MLIEFTMPSRHEWQIEAGNIIDSRTASGLVDTLIVAGVGAGKTRLGLLHAVKLFHLGEIHLAIIVVPTERLVKQWCSKAAEMGLKLTGLHGNGKLQNGLPGDVHGYVVTYQSVAAWPDLHQAIAANRGPTLVILDECHHMGDVDKTSWGPNTKRAFDRVECRLSLSGTPYRSSGQPIPWVRYKPKSPMSDIQILDHDFSYSYGRAVADEICRRVTFCPYDGQIKFKDDAGHKYDHSFADELKEPWLLSARLRAAGTPRTIDARDNELLLKMLTEADARLTDMRNAGHINAAGLIICNDMNHARDIAPVVQRVAKERPLLVLSDDENASDRLDDFENGASRWVIAVRMVTEGVDIPRLRLCVYLSQITEELFFQQVVGRIVRVQSGPRRALLSYFFFFADKRLVEHAQKIEEEVERALAQRKLQIKTPGPPTPPRSRVDLLEADGIEGESILAGESFTADEIEAAEQLVIDYPDMAKFSSLDRARMAQTLQRRRSPRPTQQSRSYDEEAKDLKDSINAKVNGYCARTGSKYNEIHRGLNAAVGCRGHDTATLEQLRQKYQLISDRLATVESYEEIGDENR